MLIGKNWCAPVYYTFNRHQCLEMTFLCAFSGHLGVHQVAAATEWSSARDNCWFLEVSMRAPGRQLGTK